MVTTQKCEYIVYNSARLNYVYDRERDRNNSINILKKVTNRNWTKSLQCSPGATRWRGTGLPSPLKNNFPAVGSSNYQMCCL